MGKKDTATAAGAEQKEVEKVVFDKIKHENIFSALAAFQGENPEIKRTKEFGKEGDSMHWFYAPLDELLITVRPLTAKHGLSFTWEPTKDGTGLVAVLYHESYSREESKLKEIYTVDSKIAEVEYSPFEQNVLRSMPISVARTGDMKKIGSDSTYARRYTLAELLGIAPDEDKDAQQFTEARREQAENAMYNRVKKGIEDAKKPAELEASGKVLAQNLADIKEGKVPQLGLSEEQLVELAELVGTRKAEVAKAGVGTGVPGENKDAGGTAELQIGESPVDPAAAQAAVPPIT